MLVTLRYNQVMDIGFLVCSNGLGHIRRICLICKFLVDRGIKVTIYGEEEKINFFLDVKYKNIIQIINFDTKTKIYNWLNGTSTEWLKQYPSSIKKHDKLISDNLLEILEIVPDSIIMASFFWHKTLPVSKKLFKNTETLLNKYNPTIISAKGFTPRYICAYEKNHQIGLSVEKERIITKFKKNNKQKILISSGSSTLYDNQISDLLANFNKNYIKSLSIEHLKIEKKFQNYCSDKIKIFNFTCSDYRDINIAIIRPSLGVITECLAANLIILPMYEKGNNEINFNAKQISLMFDVPIFTSIFDAFKYIDERLIIKSKKPTSFDGPADLYKLLETNNI